jgi:general secretion pathway protein G
MRSDSHNRDPRRRRMRAFTLIELLLVLVILAVLAAVVVPKFTNRSEQARVTTARTDIRMLETAIDMFEVDCGRFPSNDEGLAALLVAPASVQASWNGPYIKRGMPVDPWGSPYIYRYPASNNPGGYDLYSLGADGRESNDDVVNWAQ